MWHTQVVSSINMIESTKGEALTTIGVKHKRELFCFSFSQSTFSYRFLKVNEINEANNQDI